MSQTWPDIRATRARRVKRGKRAVRGNNATVAKQNPPTGGGIHCLVCINRGNYADDPRGVTVVKPQQLAADHPGYAACPDHIDLVNQPGFDAAMLRNDARRPV